MSVKWSCFSDSCRSGGHTWRYLCVYFRVTCLRQEQGTSIHRTAEREPKFSETPSQDRATLYVRTGAKRPFAPVEYPRSRHLATPSHKNSLAVSEKTSSKKVGE